MTVKRTLLVTGASSGIGAQVCQLAMQHGHEVIGVARYSHHSPNDSDPSSASMIKVALDITDPSACEQTVAQIVSQHNIDGLVCCAGSGRFGSLEEFSIAQINDLIQINLLAHMNMCRFLIPTLKTRQRSDIVFIGSENALKGGRFGAVYSAAKAGLRGFAQALQYECAPSNCHVGIVNPGMTRTEFFESLDFEPGDDENNAIDPLSVAQAVLQMLSTPDNSIIDEINISPLKKVVRKKGKNNKPN